MSVIYVLKLGLLSMVVAGTRYTHLTKECREKLGKLHGEKVKVVVIEESD
jgi:hypothetical protein